MKVDTERSVIKSDVPYGVVIFFIIGFAYSCYQTLIGADKPSYIILPDWWILTLLSGFCIPLTCETMMIDKRGIKIYHLGINTRTISWASVSQAVLVPYSGTTPKQKALLFILDNGPSYRESDSAYSYKYKHPSSSYVLFIPNSQIEPIVALINTIMWEHIKPVNLGQAERKEIP